jgi:penicillin-binding protein 1A
MDRRRFKTPFTGKQAKQVSLEAYRKALKAVRAPEWRWKPPADREGWIRVAVVAIAVLVVVVVTASGVVAGMALAFNRKLPDVSALYAPPEEATRVYAANGELIASLFRENRDFIPLDEIPVMVRQAVIAIEDDRFYHHRGVDVRGTVRAVIRNLLAGGVVEGGSTITQQLARNMFLSSRRLVSRKLAEIMLALEIERRLTKDEILERYLNQVYFGNGAYGVQMAARVYFGKSARDLTLSEGAMLAGIIRSPSVATPFQNFEVALERQHVVLRRMAELGYVTPQQSQEAIDEPVAIAKEGNAGLVGIRAPYFVSYILPYLLERYGEDVVYSGGLRIYTTLDPQMQDAAEKALQAGLDQAEKEQLDITQGAVVTLDPRTGQIRAMIGGYDFSQSQFNRAWQAHRQPGSSFKVFIYTAAVAKGMTTTRMIVDEPITFEIAGTVKPEDSIWTPKNYDDSYRGPMLMRQALEQSINIPAIKTINEFGPQAVVEYAKRMGITSRLQPNLSLALGTNDVTPLEMASAIGTLATLGVHAEPQAILRITDREGRVLEEHAPRRSLALTADVAYMMTDLLKGVILRGTGTAANIGRPAAGKTGTTDDYRNAWFIGYTPYLVTTVWVGNDDNAPMKRVVGGTVPARIWSAYMKVAVRGTPPDDWPRPDGVVAATVCGTSGLLATSTCPNPNTEIFIRGTEPTEFDLSAAPPPAVGTGTVIAAVPLRITAPVQGQAVTAPFTIEGATDPAATVNLSIVAQGSFVKINVADTRVPLTADGQFSYLFQPTLHVTGVQYLITVTATTANGGRATTTLIVNER